MHKWAGIHARRMDGFVSVTNDWISDDETMIAIDRYGH
jgi:hypothetical protein